ncbi:thiol reductant ABC exporter subunit CydC [Rhodobacter sp. NTK016B]|uniref:thiol reductant ABC exporter subunit CydC n=1 Tax=Rhodobacter sp. NTK016B TaxID=2759676 RepID=UPI001A8C4E22|nr:thiol reductant ABC exporter subunit CydC [Rhodobacter sp. NTK016B]MBN8294493.1 thiol reductant ABC exporter subunit CydC [Rhodobacter sp. NTK016B]
MRAVLRAMLRGQMRPLLLQGLALSVLVLAMGAALLGLSGWFITATAAAGMAGAGLIFDVFRPSAGIRFLAIGRTAARYGERLLTHDAVLRGVAALRLRLLAAQTRAPFEALTRLRAGESLNRLGADVEALDGVLLRLLIPGLAAITVLAGAFGMLWWLVDLRIAASVTGCFTLGALLVGALVARRAARASRGLEDATQDYRREMVDLLRTRRERALQGTLADSRARLGRLDHERRQRAARLDRIERTSGAALALVAAAAPAAAIWLGGAAALGGGLSPALAAIGVFVALALAEAVAPLRRGLGDYGRIAQAARRVAPVLRPALPQPSGQTTIPAGAALSLDTVTLRRGPDRAPVLDRVSMTLTPGERVALAGASGSGKSTLLMLAAGVLTPTEGAIRLGDLPLDILPPEALRRAITLVPQRAALVQGSVAENLRLAAPEASDAELYAALEATQLAAVIHTRGGLQTRLGPRGAGLSGGEARRLVLARAVLRRPAFLLLDEPTEGLDAPTAQATLTGLAQALPQTAMLIAAHRHAEMAFADRVLRVMPNGHLAATQSPELLEIP